MKPEKRRLGFDAFLPLALSVLFAFAILAGAIIYGIYLMPSPLFYGLIFGGLGGELILIFFYRKKISQLFKQRRILEKANLWFFIVISLAILALINLLGSNMRLRFDITKTKEWTLSEGTRDILKNLDKNVTIMTFFDEDDWIRQRGIDLLNEYALEQSLIQVIHHDTSNANSMAQKYSVEARTILISCDERRVKIFDPTEEKISAAINKVTRDDLKKIAFTVGHGELRIDNHRRRGLSAIARIMMGAGFLVDELSLSATNKVPEDISALMIMGPRVNFLPNESQAIKEYLDDGGSVLIALDPESPNDFPWLRSEYGMDCLDGLLVDPASHLMKDATTPLITRFYAHPATENMTQVFFPGARAFKMAKKMGPVEYSPIADTSLNSWLERDINTQILAYDPGVDIKGPLSIGFFLNINTEKPARLVLLGDSDFPTNGFQDSAGNMALLLSSVSWLIKDDEGLRLSSGAKPMAIERLELSNFTLKAILFTTTVIIPGLFIIAGAVIWLRRS